MLNCRYGASRYTSSGGDPGKLGRFCEGHSRRLGGVKDCGAFFNRRRTEAWLDGPRFGLDADELKSLDPGHKFGWIERPEEQADPWAALTRDAPDCPGSGAAFRPVASRIWPKPGSLGRPHAGRALKATIRVEDASTAGPEMDASIGISAKTSQLFLSSSSGRRGEAISPGVKKNSKIWGHGRRWFFRMKQGSACILDWGGAGLREDILFASRQRANTSSVLICRGGWRPSSGASE
jgi:hypothetical protein